jgi:hypothetical protein
VTQLQLAVRPTSWLCLKQIRDEGLVGQMQLTVLELLVEHGPLTGREVDQLLAAPGATRTSFHKRLPELERLGLVRVLPARQCAISGRLAVAWQAVDALPSAPAARPTKLERLVDELCATFETSQLAWTGPEVAHLIRRMAGTVR